MHREAETLAHWIELEPGDGTRYEFLVAPVPVDAPSEDPSVFVASVGRGWGAPAFVGYAYTISDLLDFAKRFPRTCNVGREHYREAVRDEAALEDHFVGYMRGHSGMTAHLCNPWTALAAIRAALLVIG